MSILKLKQKRFVVFALFLLLLLSLTACSVSNTTKTEKLSDKKKTVEKSPLSIVKATANQDGQMIVVNVKIKNNTSSAQTLKPELFALVSNSTILSPDTKSEIPQQVPANTMAEIKLQFEIKNIEGKIPIKLAYQPINLSTIQKKNNFLRWII